MGQVRVRHRNCRSKRRYFSRPTRRIACASVTVQAMIDVLERCFSTQLNSENWQVKMKQLVPSYGESLIDDAGLLKQVRERTLSTLKLL